MSYENLDPDKLQQMKNIIKVNLKAMILELNEYISKSSTFQLVYSKVKLDIVEENDVQFTYMFTLSLYTIKEFLLPFVLEL